MARPQQRWYRIAVGLALVASALTGVRLYRDHLARQRAYSGLGSASATGNALRQELERAASRGPVVTEPHDPACEQACRNNGRCVRLGARCIAVDQAACRRSYLCRSSGRCTLRDKRCVVSSDDDCERSLECAERGECSYDGVWRRCAVLDAASCRAARRCREEKLGCLLLERTFRNPLGDLQTTRVCHGATPRACRASTACARWGLCAAGTREGRTVCFAATDAQCRRSEACRLFGECGRTVRGRCAAMTADHCKRAAVCTELGLCAATFSQERLPRGCGLPRATTRARNTALEERALASVRLVPGTMASAIRRALGEPHRVRVLDGRDLSGCELQEGLPSYLCGVQHEYQLARGGALVLTYSHRGALRFHQRTGAAARRGQTGGAVRTPAVVRGPCVASRGTLPRSIIARRHLNRSKPPGELSEAGELAHARAHCTLPDCRVISAGMFRELASTLKALLPLAARRRPRRRSPHHVSRSIEVRWARTSCVFEDGPVSGFLGADSAVFDRVFERISATLDATRAQRRPGSPP